MAKNKNKDKKRSKKNKSRRSARTADKYELYQWSVQSPREDVEFLANAYAELRNRRAPPPRGPLRHRPAQPTWIGRGLDYTAEVFANDPEPVEWGKARHFADLTPAAKRMTFFMNDVRAPSGRPPDIRCAHNFSYWVIKKRVEMLAYFRGALTDLADEGIFVIDLHGGPKIHEEMEEATKISQASPMSGTRTDTGLSPARPYCISTFVFPTRRRSSEPLPTTGGAGG